jgi:hypothetical protein
MAGTLEFLDLDLDAFLDRVAHWKRGKRRLNKRHYHPWSEANLREFLDKQCGLSRETRIPGRFVIEHDGAFDYWKEIVINRRASLDIVHIDGHADLGMGDNRWVDIVGNVVRRPVLDRGNPQRGAKYLNAGSYVAYGLAARWINSLTYVHPQGEGNDLPEMYFQNNDPSSGYMQLKGFDQAVIAEAGRRLASLKADQAAILEPSIPFKKVLISNFLAANSFDYGLLCQSPGYTPSTADALIAIIEDYISFEKSPQTPIGSR